MKILIVHNEYGKRSGEEAVVDKMAEIFGALGHEVSRLTMSTAEARESLGGKVRTFVAGIYSPRGVRAMRAALDRFRPDVVNVHNLYPFISPAALRECKRRGVPVVMTVHNFRLICPTGLFMRNGGPCELCLERGNEWGCVRYNCERSWPKSVAYAARNAVARLRRHYRDCVDVFACITDFQRQKLLEAGFERERLWVVPNCVSLIHNAQFIIGFAECPFHNELADGLADGDRRGRLSSYLGGACHPRSDEYVGFVGRLSREKGIDLIIEVARRNPDIRFRLAGAVADESLVADLPANVELAGFVSGAALDEFYAGARFILLASRCYEGFPMAILEAAQHERATIGPRHGGFVEILSGIHNAQCRIGFAECPFHNDLEQGGENALLFEAGSVEDLERAVRGLWDSPELAAQLGRAARAELEAKYSTEVVTARWHHLLTTLKP